MAAMRRIHVLVSPDLVARLDAAAERRDVSRGEFVRRAVEQALGSPAPAEQPETPDYIKEGGMAPLSSYGRAPHQSGSESSLRRAREAEMRATQKR